MACDSVEKTLQVPSKVRNRHNRKRPWLDSWNTEVSDNGEPLKTWCLRRAKMPGVVRCKYCKVIITFSSKGVAALRNHANSKRHLINARTDHLNLKAAIVNGKASSGKPVSKPNKKPHPPSSTKNKKKPPPPSSSSSSTTAAIGGGQNKVKLKHKATPNGLKLKSSTAIRTTQQQPHRLNHGLVVPSSVSNSKKSPVTATSLQSKVLVVPILSKKFLQFKNKPSKVPSRRPSSKTPPPPAHTHHSPFSQLSQKSKPLKPLSPFLGVLAKQKSPTNTTSLHQRQQQYPGHKLTTTTTATPLSTPRHLQQQQQQRQLQFRGRNLPQSLSSHGLLASSSAGVINGLRASPILPAALSSSQYLGHHHGPKSHRYSHQVYSNANLRTTGSPCLGQAVEQIVKLIPVFVCYFCLGEFPSKSSLYEHQEKCTVKLESENNKADNLPTSTTTTSMEGILSTLVTANTKSLDEKVSPDLPTTPNNPKQRTNAFFPSSPVTPQKSSSSSLSLKLPSSTPSPAKINNVSKSGFLNGFNLLPIKTALLEQQKRISRKRRNTECESLDWEEDDLVPPTPKTPCSTPSTPKLLISHLSREEYRRELPPHRLFRLASDSSTRDVNVKQQPDKDVNGVVNGSGNSSSSSHHQEIAPTSHSHHAAEKEEKEDGENGDGSGSKHDGKSKISVVRSLYNVDVTSPLGQFVSKYYKADPSLHILSDIESHCITSDPTSSSSSSSSSTKTTNCTLRARIVNYPILFGTSGRRLLFHDYYHSYKFNKLQVREFMKTANTGLNKDSRRLLRQMKKCQVVLRRISKADLHYWISSQNNITVNLKPLSEADIALWTSPSSLSSSPSSSSSEDSESVFPDGLKSTSPAVKTVLGLKTKQEVCIRTVNMLSPSILNITNYVSEETCADLLSNRKTVYQSLISDWSQCDSENVDVSNTNSNSNNTTNTSQEQQQLQQKQNNNNTVLRRMLNNRAVLGHCLSDNNLPDITNLTIGKEDIVTAGDRNTNSNSTKLAPVKNIITTKSKSKIAVEIKSKTNNTNTNSDSCVAKNPSVLLLAKGSSSSSSKSNENDVTSKSKPKQINPVVEVKPAAGDSNNIDKDKEMSSCQAFVTLPKPCDLLRDKTPSLNSCKRRQLTPKQTSTSTTSASTFFSSSSSSAKRRKSERHFGPKWIGPNSVSITSYLSDSHQDIRSVDDNPALLKSFFENFKSLRVEQKKEQYQQQQQQQTESNSRGKKSSALDGGSVGSGSVNKRRRGRPTRNIESPVVNTTKPADVKVENCEETNESDVSLLAIMNKNTTSKIEIITNDNKDIEQYDKDKNKKDKNTGALRNASLVQRSYNHVEKGNKDKKDENTGELSNVSQVQRSSRSSSAPSCVRKCRRKSSPRITKGKVGLNRRLSAAGLVKRETSLESPVRSGRVVSNSNNSVSQTQSLSSTKPELGENQNTSDKFIGSSLPKTKTNNSNFQVKNTSVDSSQSITELVNSQEKIKNENENLRSQNVRESPMVVPPLKMSIRRVVDLGSPVVTADGKVAVDLSPPKHYRSGLSRRRRCVLSSSPSSSLASSPSSLSALSSSSPSSSPLLLSSPQKGRGSATATLTETVTTRPQKALMCNGSGDGSSSRNNLSAKRSPFVSGKGANTAAGAGGDAGSKNSSKEKAVVNRHQQPSVSKGDGILQLLSSFKMM